MQVGAGLFCLFIHLLRQAVSRQFQEEVITYDDILYSAEDIEMNAEIIMDVLEMEEVEAAHAF